MQLSVRRSGCAWHRRRSSCRRRWSRGRRSPRGRRRRAPTTRSSPRRRSTPTAITPPSSRRWRRCRATPGRGGTLSASYVADVVSSASIDVVSNATKQMTRLPQRDHRRPGAEAAATPRCRGSYVYSVENDYQSHNAELGFAQDLFEKNSTLALGATLSANDVCRTGDQLFHRKLLVAGLSGRGPRCSTAPPSRSCRTRSRTATATGRAPIASCASRRRIWPPSSSRCPRPSPTSAIATPPCSGSTATCSATPSLQGDYRFYADNWGILAHTVQLRYFVTWSDVTLGCASASTTRAAPASSGRTTPRRRCSRS